MAEVSRDFFFLATEDILYIKVRTEIEESPGNIGPLKFVHVSSSYR